jgi:hypothetical protein
MKKKEPFCLLVIVLFIVICTGCISDRTPEKVTIPDGQFSSYEINLSADNLTNSTTYYLYTDKKNKTTQAVTTIVNTSTLNITIQKDISAHAKSKEEYGIEDLVIIANFSCDNKSDRSNFSSLSNTSYNTSYYESSTTKMISIEFAQPTTGFVACSFSGEFGYFHQLLTRNETIIVVLPPKHSTGNIILGGITKPKKPDETYTDENNRLCLLWNNPYPDKTIIDIRYYKSILPAILTITVLVLGTCILIISLYYSNEIRKSRKKRELINSKIK